MLCTSSFLDDVMFSHNGATGPGSDDAYTSSSSPGGNTGVPNASCLVCIANVDFELNISGDLDWDSDKD